MKKILAVGNLTLDILSTVSNYPAEDTEVRASHRSRQAGGNAFNTLATLAQAGHHCRLAAVCTQDSDGRYLQDQLLQTGIDAAHLQLLNQGSMPTSCITISAENGSRSIIHYRDLPEYDDALFAALPLMEFDWVHFEGRNVPALQRMLSRLKETAPDIPCSLEIEKSRQGIEALYEYCQVLIFSKHFAEEAGYQQATDFLQAIRTVAPSPQLVCAWGDQGAWGMQSDEVIYSPAVNVSNVVDTLAAGDVFNAGLIDSLLKCEPLGSALNSACQLAGRKCAQSGIGNLY